MSAAKLCLALFPFLALSATEASPLAVLERNGAYVSVEAYGPNIVRITLAVDKALAAGAPGYGILPAAADNKPFKHGAGDGDLFVSKALRLHVDTETPHGRTVQENYFAPLLPPVHLQVSDAKGTLLLAMTGWEMAPHEVSGEATYQVGARFAAYSGEHFYGLGQNQEGFLDLRGRTIDCKHWYDAPAGETVCIPFMVSSKGYAVVWDNPSETFVSAAISGVTHWSSKVGERVSFFVIVGTPAEIYEGYARLTGKTPLPPKAAFGLIQSKARYASQGEVLEVAETYRRKNYPLDIMVVDWFSWTRMGEMDIDPAQFPDPDAMNRQLHAMGLRSMISVWPRYERAGRYFAELERQGFFLKDKDGKTVDGLPFRSDRAGALLDATNPAARAWFWTRLRDNILSRGFDYPWLDENEPDLVPAGHFYSIGSGDRWFNLYPLLHVEGVAEGMRAWKPDTRPLILSRAAYLGSQRTGALFWSSDIAPSWEALRRQIPAGLNMAASGIAYWGNDIGGWQELPATTEATHLLIDPSEAREVVGGFSDYPELLVRWFEYGTFLPTLRLHGSRKHTEIWAYGRQAETILAEYDRLRYRLIPYIYTAARAVTDTGLPLMRPLWMDFPSDPEVADLGGEYMFGPAFLVAPVTEQGQTKKKVYLPRGANWFDYWTKKKFKGGRWVEVEAPIERIPLFVMAGSIVPVGSDVPSTAAKQDIVRLDVYPGADADFTLYDDDGVSTGYERGRGVKEERLHWKNRSRRMLGPLAILHPELIHIVGKPD